MLTRTLLLALLVLPLLPTAVFAQTTSTGVVQVVDANTLDVLFDDGTQDQVRLLGLELSDQCLGPDAIAYAHGALDGQSVALELDPAQVGRDALGRLPAQVRLADGTDAGQLLTTACTGQAPQQNQQNSPAAEPVPATPSPVAVAPPPVAAALPPVAATLPPPVRPAAKPQTYTGPYDPSGPDRDCPDFRTQAEAQAFFIAAGGPRSDRHRLDADHDGIACEALP